MVVGMTPSLWLHLSGVRTKIVSTDAASKQMDLSVIEFLWW